MKILPIFFSMMLFAQPIQAAERSKILSHAQAVGIPVEVMMYVAKKESGLRCSPRNPRYHGPLQISKSSAKALGWNGKGSLNNCEQGLVYGAKHLKLCVNKVGNNPKAAARCHASPGSFGVKLSRK